MNEEQEKEILNEAKIQTARHKKKIQIISNNSGHSNGYSGVYTSYKSASQRGRHCGLGA